MRRDRHFSHCCTWPRVVTAGKARVAAMQAPLRRLIYAQEMYHQEYGTYTSMPNLHDHASFCGSPDVMIGVHFTGQQNWKYGFRGLV